MSSSLRQRKTDLAGEANDTKSSMKMERFSKTDSALDRFILLFVHRKEGEEFNYFMIGYLAYFHILAVLGLLLATHDVFQMAVNPLNAILLSQPLKTLLWTWFLWPFSGLGITAGCHRFWAHKAYEATTGMKIILMIQNSIANQKTIYHWSIDHRTHHRFSDTQKDPHDSNRGLFYAHIGWLLFKKPKAVVEAGAASIDMSDLDADKVVQFQKNLDPYWNMFWCFVFPAVFANYAWNENLLAGFLLPGCFRYIFVLHCTWCVNSLVHTPIGGPSTYD